MSHYLTFEYKDGSKYCGECEGGVLHGFGILVEPGGRGVFEGLWAKGNQMSGIYTWPNGRHYVGDWKGPFRSGLGLETRPDGTKYTGEFSQSTMGPLGVLSLPSHGLYMGTWSDTGLQEGDGVEAYADGGKLGTETQPTILEGLYLGIATSSHKHDYYKGKLSPVIFSQLHLKCSWVVEKVVGYGVGKESQTIAGPEPQVRF